VCELLIELQRLPADCSPNSPDIQRVVESAVRRGLVDSGAELARSAGIAKATLSGLISGQRGGLDTYLRLAVAADVGLAGLFVPRLWREGIVGHAAAQHLP
jgi:hypothetical protein